MNIKNNSEKDPARCRLLRQNERQFSQDIKETAVALRSAINKVSELRNELKQMRAKERRIQGLILGATIPFGGPRAVGHAMNGLAQNLSTELAVLQSRIGALEADIKKLENEISQLKPRSKQLTSGFEQNARQLTELNCVK